MVYNAVFHMYRDKGFKALAGKLRTLIAACNILFSGTFPKSVTAVDTMCRHPVGKATFTNIRKGWAGTAKKSAYTGKVGRIWVGLHKIIPSYHGR